VCCFVYVRILQGGKQPEQRGINVKLVSDPLDRKGANQFLSELRDRIFAQKGKVQVVLFIVGTFRQIVAEKLIENAFVLKRRRNDYGTAKINLLRYRLRRNCYERKIGN
jgi:hypothetical protein